MILVKYNYLENMIPHRKERVLKVLWIKEY